MNFKIVALLTVFYLMNTSCVTRSPKHIETTPNQHKSKTSHKYRD